MEEKFDLNKMPTSVIYSESEETKQLRHLLYRKQKKIITLKILFNISTILGIALLFIGFIKILINSITNKIENQTNILQVNFIVIIGAIILIAGISIGIYIKQFTKNTLEPITQDIERSVMNDQLELIGARSNRRNNKITEENNLYENNPNKIDNYKKLEQNYNELSAKYEELLKLFQELQDENIKTNNYNKKLNNKYSKLKTEYNEIKNSIPNKTLKTKELKTESNNINLNLKPEKSKKHKSILLLTLALLLNTALFVLGVVSLILQFNTKTTNLTLIICLIIASATLLYSEFVICIYLHESINKYYNDKRS